MKIKRIQDAILPTLWGEFKIIGFQEKGNDKNHVVLTYGNINHKKPVLVRIHSECLTGDALFSLRCDCGEQLKTSLALIAESGSGILIYHRQEGRNIGLLNKIKAYHLQDQGLDTVEANHKLGFSADERDFTICSDILKLMHIKKIILLTNNPLKVKILVNAGINIVKRMNLIVKDNPKNKKYLNTKINKMGHLIS
ncbi:GTP cyclohydrolase II [Buchnera aphidicola]|uniref:GTP cyclohydrolase-2 n=1 Tax=Buchnera aphidicola (Sarucallis kahawaluokalani) TaxID=1241878 RepID=A0A4D6YCW6_9GAMM|nr:GTP cyclohydrolase II [Buchnera aphidicola]QCI25983.1 GTP cyclohydrolase II [Buchnera aphidicola (Sarucallis kahawaluokalani)]